MGQTFAVGLFAPADVILLEVVGIVLLLSPIQGVRNDDSHSVTAGCTSLSSIAPYMSFRVIAPSLSSLGAPPPVTRGSLHHVRLVLHVVRVL